MNLAVAKSFAPLTELLRLYSDADEIIFKNHGVLDKHTVADLCRDARHLARYLRLHHPRRSAGEIAQILAIQVSRDEWQVAEGRVVYLAECRLRPPQISLNTSAISKLANRLRHWAGEGEQVWFTEAQITEAAIAHELYHVLEQRPSRSATELAAHAFARELIGLPFSPLLYSALSKQ